jgi:hypothetical protein
VLGTHQRLSGLMQPRRQLMMLGVCRNKRRAAATTAAAAAHASVTQKRKLNFLHLLAPPAALPYTVIGACGMLCGMCCHRRRLRLLAADQTRAAAAQPAAAQPDTQCQNTALHHGGGCVLLYNCTATILLYNQLPVLPS